MFAERVFSRKKSEKCGGDFVTLVFQRFHNSPNRETVIVSFCFFFFLQHIITIVYIVFARRVNLLSYIECFAATSTHDGARRRKERLIGFYTFITLKKSTRSISKRQPIYYI